MWFMKAVVHTNSGDAYGLLDWSGDFVFLSPFSTSPTFTVFDLNLPRLETPDEVIVILEEAADGIAKEKERKKRVTTGCVLA